MKINAEKSSVKEWLSALSGASKGKRYQKLWKRVYSLVEVPARRRAVVNLSKINSNTREGDNVVVPGKVLSNGRIGHRVNISAIEFSGPALKMLKDANCNVVELKEMLNAEKVHVII